MQKILVGQLIVDMADVKNKSFVFCGTASDTLSDKPEKNQNKLDKALARCSRKFRQRRGRSNSTDSKLSTGNQPFLET